MLRGFFYIPIVHIDSFIVGNKLQCEKANKPAGSLVFIVPECAGIMAALPRITSSDCVKKNINYVTVNQPSILPSLF